MATVKFSPPSPYNGASFNWSSGANWDLRVPITGDSILFVNPLSDSYVSVIDSGYPANVNLSQVQLQPNVTLDVRQSITISGNGIVGDSSTDGTAAGGSQGLVLIGNGATLTDMVSANQTLYMGSDGIGARGTFVVANPLSTADIGNTPGFSGPATLLTVNGLKLDMVGGQSDGLIILQNATFDSTDAVSHNAVWYDSSGGGTFNNTDSLELAGNSVANLSSANYIDSAGIPAGIVQFTGTGNELILPSDRSFSAASTLQIQGFGVTDKIEFAGITVGSAKYVLGAVVGGIQQPNTLDVYSGANGSGSLLVAMTGVTLDTSFTPTGNFSDFVTGTDANGHYLALACFAAGTRIETSRGPVEVEHLREGDVVVTCGSDDSRGEAPVKWIGRRHIDLARHPEPALVQPVRFAPGSLGEGLPAQPLRVSPEHAFYFDGVMIQARHLVNGVTIVQESVSEVTYFHVELPRHDVVLAEGVPTESWLDTGNRSMFENTEGATDLVADFQIRSEEAWSANGCAPLVADGPIVDAVRRRIAARAVSLGHQGDGTQLVALAADQEITVRVEPGARVIRLLSGVMVAPNDRRRLGAVIRECRIGGERLRLDDGRFGPGFHEVEHDGAASWRWTDGDAILFVNRAMEGQTLTVQVCACADLGSDPAVLSPRVANDRAFSAAIARFAACY